MQEYADVAGTGFYGRATTIRKYCQAGQYIKLKREPKNKFDLNAIAVYLQCPALFGFRHKYLKIGYIPSEQNLKLAELMDNGTFLSAYVVSFWAPLDKEHPRVTIRVTDEYD